MNIQEIYQINKLMKKEGIKFKENAIDNLNNISEFILKLFELTIKYIENKKGEHLFIIEKIKYLENKLLQENYNEIIKGEKSVSLGLYFISLISFLVNISFNLEKIISIFKQEIINTKNKSFEHIKDCILLIRDTNSNSTKRISLESSSIKNECINEKINQSIN